MKKILRTLILTSLALLIALSCAACTKKPDKGLEIKIYALNGTTALGMSQMISKVDSGTSEMNYKIEKFASADAITGTIVSGECAIAALPTNVAAKLYRANPQKIQVLAANTLGVLYLLQNGENITDFNSLHGKTVYLPGAGSNPEYITSALLAANGITDVTLDTTTYPSPDSLQTALVSNLITLAVLPEPKVTVTMMNNKNVSVAMNFTEKWESVYGENSLVQGCLVVNSDFAKAHPAEISAFLDDYKASVEYIKAGSDDAIAMIVSAGILPKEAIAKKALPGCNLCFLEGVEMKTALNTFYEKIFAASPASIGAMPDDAFYYAR